MSWNVESLGDAKAYRSTDHKSKLIKYLQYAIQRAHADLVGIMELKAGVGAQVRDWLLAKLNNARPQGAPYQWRARLSSRQDGGTQEEYLLLWKDEPNRLELDSDARPGPSWLIGVVDDNALETFVEQFMWDDADRQQLYDALASLSYTVKGIYRDRGSNVRTRTDRVGLDKWHALDAAGGAAAVDFAGATPAPPAGMNAAKRQQLAQILLTIDVLRFPTYAERSPFIAGFKVGNPPRLLKIGLLHAPGPQDPGRFDAINIMSLSRPLEAAPNLLLMGDFNIAQTDVFSLGRNYVRAVDNQGKFTFALRVPTSYTRVFEPISDAPLNAPDQIGNVKTSLVNTFLDDGSLIAAALANTYDKFFFRGTAGQMAAANARVVNPIVAMAGNQAGYDVNLGTAGLTFFRAFRGVPWLTERQTRMALDSRKELAKRNIQERIVTTEHAKFKTVPLTLRNGSSAISKRQTTATKKRDAYQKKEDGLDAQLRAIRVLLALVNAAASPSPTGIGTSHAVYRHAVTDHLPITIELTTP